MPKGTNATNSRKITITISDESGRLLDRLAQNGIYGRNAAEVAGRFVDRALEEFIERPKLKLGTRKAQMER